jgi:hypothetical protein
MSGAGNPAFGKTYRSKATHPDWVEKISKTSKERKINSGDSNGMKNHDVAAKMSKTRRNRITSDPNYRAKISKMLRKAWADGKYDGVKTGRCRWYDHQTPDNDIVKLQGTWEVIFAKYLDKIGVKYIAHRGRIAYSDAKGIMRSYYPDFFVPETNTYYDVKGAFFDDIQREKISFIKKSNPNVRLEIFNAQRFAEVGIDIEREATIFRKSQER